MDQQKVVISVWSNNPLLEKLFHGHHLHLNVDFVSEKISAPYFLFLVDLSFDLSSVSQKLISIYETCRENKQKLVVALIHGEKIDTEKNLYFQNLLEKISADKPLHRLVNVKDMYQTDLLTPVTWFDTFLLQVVSSRKIDITTKGENCYFPVSVHDFLNGLLKIFFLVNTGGKTFWLSGDPISDLDLAYLIKKKLENVDDEEFEINATLPVTNESIHLRTLANQTSAVLNWEQEDDFFEVVADITRRLADDKTLILAAIETKNRQLPPVIENLLLLIQKIKFFREISLKNKVKQSIDKLQYVYLKRGIEILFFSVILIYLLISISFVGLTALGLKTFSDSYTDLKKGNIQKSVKSLKLAQSLVSVGESSYSFLSPIIRLADENIDKKNFNLFSFAHYLGISLANVQQTYLLGLNIYSGLSSGNTSLSGEDAALAIKSNLSQVYENLNQIEILSQAGRLPDYLESKLKENTEFKKISALEQQISMAIKAADLLPTITSGEIGKNVVILFQNNNEIHGSGGRLDYALVLVLDRGKIVSNKVYSASELDSLAVGTIQAPPLLKKILNYSDWKFRDLNYNPDFPQTAENISWYLERILRFKPDAIISVDNSFLSDIVFADGQLALDDQIVTKTSFRNIIASSNPGLYKQLIGMFADDLTQGKLSPLILSHAVAKQMGESNLYFWTSDPVAQKSVLDQPYSGAIVNYLCHSALLSLSNCLSQTTYINETSISLTGYLNERQRRYTHRVWLRQNSIDHEYSLIYKNISSNPKIDNPNVKIYQLYVTSPSTLGQIIFNDSIIPQSNVEKQTHNGLDRYQIPIVLSEDKDCTINISFSTPMASFASLPLGYSLTEYRQPGLGEEKDYLEINYPSSAKPSAITSQIELSVNKFSYPLPPKTTTFGVSFVPNQQ